MAPVELLLALQTKGRLDVSIPFISIESVEHKLSWTEVADAILAGHKRDKARLGDLALEKGVRSMLNRAAWIDGVGLALKSVTIFPDNAEKTPPLPTIESVVVLFDAESGAIKAFIDGQLVTKWKTAGDSVLGAKLLAPSEPKSLLVVGSGVVAGSLIDAYRELFPSIADIKVWSRTTANAEQLAAEKSVKVAGDLAQAVSAADIVSSATMARQPVLKGEWVTNRTHIDLIGAFLPDMREADDDLVSKGRLFVDSRETTIEHIGELMIPIANGVLKPESVEADFYELAHAGAPARQSNDEITVFKNGGGAHLDLMVANLIYEKWSEA